MCLYARLAEAAAHRPHGWTAVAAGERFPLEVTVGTEGDSVMWVRFYAHDVPVTAPCVDIEFEGVPVYFANAAVERNRAASILLRFHTGAPANTAA